MHLRPFTAQILAAPTAATKEEAAQAAIREISNRSVQVFLKQGHTCDLIAHAVTFPGFDRYMIPNLKQAEVMLVGLSGKVCRRFAFGCEIGSSNPKLIAARCGRHDEIDRHYEQNQLHPRQRQPRHLDCRRARQRGGVYEKTPLQIRRQAYRRGRSTLPTCHQADPQRCKVGTPQCRSREGQIRRSIP